MYKRIGGIFPKLVVAFLAVIIPLCALGIMMNRMGEESVRSEWVSSMSSRTMFYLNTLELENRHILDLLSENVYDSDLSHLSVLSDIMSEFEWAEAVKRVQAKLRTIRHSSIYVKSASAHILTLGRTINDTKGILGAIDEDYEAVKPKGQFDDSAVLSWHDRLFIRQAFPNGSPDPSFVLSVEINRSELQGTLRNMANYGQAGAALISLSGDWDVAFEESAEFASTSASEEGADADAVGGLREFLRKENPGEPSDSSGSMELNGTAMQTSCRYSGSLGAYLCLYVPQKQMFGQIAAYRSWFWVLSGASILIILLYSYGIYRMIHRPLRKMIHSFRRVEDGRLEPVVPPKGKDEFRYLYLHFNRMVDYLKTLIHDNYEQKLRAKQAQIKQLQSQINPHFLYNTYFILYRLSEFGDLESIGRFSRYLGEYFEFITRHKEDTIPMELEVRHTMTYLEIQNMRFFNRFAIEVAELHEDCRSVYVPKLVLQPIVENAFKYALEPRMAGGRLRVSFERTDDRILIEVEDNGERLTDEELESLDRKLKQSWEEEESTGMINVHRRLRLLCGEDSGVSVSRGKWGGLKVTLSIRVEDK
ncbi:sensor histidine kinase [Cohnella silvisoli]|uniref:Histidine kinase n=1 Tax=Cohnella silvisoli TaxID=2873699 RepID=A0ABV1KYR6_9BACL|nr:histidine kinase [Cohnella silvisoli]MCD9024105.1 histidine kinase [Cohnella silvisoli]